MSSADCTIDATRQTGGDWNGGDGAPGDLARQSGVSIDQQQQSVPGVLALFELILKDRVRLERTVRDAALAAQLVPKFLAIALLGFTLFGVALAVAIGSVGLWPELNPIRDVLAQGTAPLIDFGARSEAASAWSPWRNGAALQLVAAYDLGLIAAAGVCLPSLYFYGLLSGVRLTMLEVVLHTLKTLSVSAVALVGLLPIYIAFAMAVAIFALPAMLVHQTLWLGLLLPFVAGLWGMQSLFAGFLGLTDTMPADVRCQRRCFLRRLVVSWAACYTAVTPVMVFTLWEYLARMANV